MERLDLAKKRGTLPDGRPIISVEAKLKAEVQRLEKKLEAARADLRRYLLSHGT